MRIGFHQPPSVRIQSRFHEPTVRLRFLDRRGLGGVCALPILLANFCAPFSSLRREQAKSSRIACLSRNGIGADLGVATSTGRRVGRRRGLICDVKGYFVLLPP